MSSKSQGFVPQFPGQREGEQVELVFHQHPLVMRKALILGLLAILVGVLPLDFPQVYAWPVVTSVLTKIAFGVPVIVFLAWGYRYLSWYFTVYIVTDQRIVEVRQKGFFDRTVSEWQLDKILHVNYRVGGFQAVLFGYGDITVRTVIGDLTIKTVHRPTKIHAQLQDIVRRGGGAVAGDDASTPFYN